MTLSISTLALPPGNYNHYSEAFRNIIEDHLEFLKNNISTQNYTLPPHDEYKYVGDMYGMFANLGISQDMFWIIMRVNGFHSPDHYVSNIGTLLIPAKHVIDELLRRHLTTLTIT